jgi:murein L,D-transpeptidase YafK
VRNGNCGRSGEGPPVFARNWRILVLVAIIFATCAAGPAFARSAWPTPENPVDYLRVLKSQRVLEAWRGGIRIRAYRIALGGNPVGHKFMEGDGRTPEGRYQLTWRKADSVAYKAFHINYPSREDRDRARIAGVKPGGSIMIHGQWDGFGWAGWLLQNYDWTNGCIGLSNADMDDLWQIVGWGTPIEILP